MPESAKVVVLPVLVVAVTMPPTMPVCVGANVTGTEIVCPATSVAGSAGEARERDRFIRGQRQRLLARAAEGYSSKRNGRPCKRRRHRRAEGENLAFAVTDIEPPGPDTRRA